MKRRKKFFRREVILGTLATIGETTLQELLDMAWSAGSFLGAMASPDSYRKLKSFSVGGAPVTIDFKSKVAFYSLISKLGKEGLISKMGDKKLKITGPGKKFWKEKRNSISWQTKYPLAKNTNSQEIYLIIFDIPEEDRAKRDWLRFHIKQLGFKQLQLSVWQGNAPLPEEFMYDLKAASLLSCVHIFSVNKKGTLA